MLSTALATVRRRRRVRRPMAVLRQIAQTSALVESSRNEELAAFTSMGRGGR